MRTLRLLSAMLVASPVFACGSNLESSRSSGAQDPELDASMTDGSSYVPPDDTSDGDAGTSEPPPREGCDMGLEVVVRDFTETHPDFEHQNGIAPLKGLVKTELGSDKKPVYAPAGSTDATSGPAGFAQWYRDVEGVNLRVPTTIAFTEQSPGVFVFESGAFFPIDGKGFGNGPKGPLDVIFPQMHNFLFTTEAHTRFTYKGGEKFTFRGDDDLWVFINGKLGVDLGGVHPAAAQTIDLDAQAEALGIVKGQTYAMDIFHAERHTDASTYRIETTIDLSCIENVDVL